MAKLTIEIKTVTHLFGCLTFIESPKRRILVTLKIPYILEYTKIKRHTIFKLFGLNLYLRAGDRRRTFWVYHAS